VLVAAFVASLTFRYWLHRLRTWWARRWSGRMSRGAAVA